MINWWRLLKQTYNRLPRLLRTPYVLTVMVPRKFKLFVATTASSKNLRVYFKGITHYAEQSSRWISYWHDLIDWIGVYPFKVLTPEAIFDFYTAREFQLIKLKTCGGGLGCNQFIFRRSPANA